MSSNINTPYLFSKEVLGKIFINMDVNSIDLAKYKVAYHQEEFGILTYLVGKGYIIVFHAEYF